MIAVGHEGEGDFGTTDNMGWVTCINGAFVGGFDAFAAFAGISSAAGLGGIAGNCNEACHGNEECSSLCEEILSELHATLEQQEYSENWRVWMGIYTSHGQMWARVTVIRGEATALVVIDTYTHTDYVDPLSPADYPKAVALTSATINYNWGKSAYLAINRGLGHLEPQGFSNFGFIQIPAYHASDIGVKISLCVDYSGIHCPSWTSNFPGFSFPKFSPAN
jgi:hypothetical protein